VSRVVSFWGKGIDLDLVPPDAPKVNYKLPGFLGKFFELQGVMWTTNAGLTDRHMYDSRPHSWPRLRRGIVSSAFVCFGSVIDRLLQNFWVKDHRQIYLIGNPLVWWLSTFSVVLYILVRGFLILRAKRGFRDFDNSEVVFAFLFSLPDNLSLSQLKW